jgi:hypothetical protein
MARELAGSQDAVERFLNWRLPPAHNAENEDVPDDEAVNDLIEDSD